MIRYKIIESTIKQKQIQVEKSKLLPTFTSLNGSIYTRNTTPNVDLDSRYNSLNMKKRGSKGRINTRNSINHKRGQKFSKNHLLSALTPTPFRNNMERWS